MPMPIGHGKCTKTLAFAIVEEGLASPEEVDRIVKSSFGFRLGGFGLLKSVTRPVPIPILPFTNTYMKN
jgi:3-hydroxyacyl-CoA dehydrogenase